MTGAFAALAFAPGLAVGSFLNVVAARLPARRSIVSPRSACASCKTPIAWLDNVPASMPGQNVLPFPVTTMTRTCGSASHSLSVR